MKLLHRQWPLAVGVLVALAISSCKSKDSGGGGKAATNPDGGASMASSGACDETAALYCEQYFRCAPEDAEADYGSLEGCRSQDATTCRRLAGLRGASAAFVESWAACNRALGAETCDQRQFGLSPEACRFPAGSRAVGEACTSSAECATTYCQHTPTAPEAPASECGVCAPALGPGAACDDRHFCDYGLTCAGGHCTRLVAEGGVCDPAGDSVCTGALVCVGGRCGRPLAEGKPCSDPGVCQDGLFCLKGQCAQPPGEGEPCEDPEGICDGDLRCLQRRCVALLPGGAVCEDDRECASDQCAPGSAGMPNTCVAAPPSAPPATVAHLGEACVLDAGAPDAGAGAGCYDHAYCDDQTRRCLLRKGTGAACAEDRECFDFLVCTDGKCAVTPEESCK